MDWSRYEFLSLLGQGGMGAVYKARDRTLGRIVALKFIRGADRQMIARFMQEARAQSRVDHPGICKVYEVGEVAGKSFIAMQFIDGTSLQQAAHSMTLMEKVQVMRDTAEAIHAAHRLGIIHRDLKPSNIMIERTAATSSGAGSLGFRPVVMDFGLAREAGEEKGLTESGAVMGTPAYMSPEQARGDVRRLDVRTDVYSLGATLYDILSGSPPFEDESVVNILLKVLHDDVRPLRERLPEVPQDLEIIVGKCLNKEPAQRYASAQELTDDLGRFLDNRRIVARRLGPYQRLRRRVQRNPPLAIAGAALLASLVVLLSYGVRTSIQNLRRERQAQQQAELARKLGEEITKMEWLLRSARQLPLHDLNREKAIVRERMESLQTEIASYGAISQGLAHYALGRGHLALHEYPQALKELRRATELGLQTAEVHYALGFVLGKHFEQAMHEARLAGGGDWAKKQLQEIEPKYLLPAIASLQKSRGTRLDAPQYLQALIAFYQRDYQAALDHAQAAVHKAPWLYEPIKLSGDVHLERALQARDSGKNEEAEREFADAVKSYEAAALIGQSDAEVYEGLAETWIRSHEMKRNNGQPADEAAYKQALAASAKIAAAEPQSIVGPLKKAYASLMMVTALQRNGHSAEKPTQECLETAEEILKRQPGHPYASEVAASCYGVSSELAMSRGEDATPYLRKALGLLEPTVKQYPNFLWGLNDLAVTNLVLADSLQSRGSPAARETIQKSLEYATKAAALDPTYLQAIVTALNALRIMISQTRTPQELAELLSQADRWFGKCQTVNSKFIFCYETYSEIYMRAAYLAFVERQNSQPLLHRAFEVLAQARPLGSNEILEMTAVLAHLVHARERLRHKQDPTAALADAQDALARCYAVAPQSVTCKMLDARIGWLRAEWLSLQGPEKAQAALASLRAAQAKALAASQSPEKDPELWQTLAEADLRLAGAKGLPPGERKLLLIRSLEAAEKALALNPSYSPALATKGALHLSRAQSAGTVPDRQREAQAAVLALELALKDRVTTHESAPLLQAARALVVPAQREEQNIASLGK